MPAAGSRSDLTAAWTPAGELEAGTILILAPAALLHPGVPQPAGRLVHALLTGTPNAKPVRWCLWPT
jgi:hypothetical protein